MTVNTTAIAVTATGNGVATVFPYAFRIPAAGDVDVYLTELATGNVTHLLASQYQITGLDNPLGGNVTYPIAGTPLPAGWQITIERIIPYTQPNAFPDQGALFNSVFELALDRLTMMMQQVVAGMTHALRAPDSDAALNEMPNATLRANMALLFDANGQPIVGAVANAPIAAAMLPVVQAGSIAAARAALGLGNMALITYTRSTKNIDFANVSDNVSVFDTFNIPGVLATDVVLGVTADGNAGTTNGVYLNGRAIADNIVISLENDSGGSFNADAQNYTVTWGRFT